MSWGLGVGAGSPPDSRLKGLSKKGWGGGAGQLCPRASTPSGKEGHQLHPAEPQARSEALVDEAWCGGCPLRAHNSEMQNRA